MKKLGVSVMAGIAATIAGASGAGAATHKDLVRLFGDWRRFEAPVV
jgi:hypothetical protein